MNQLEHEHGHGFQARGQEANRADLTAATTLRPEQTMVRVTSNTTYPSWTLTLPPVAKAQGRLFSIIATIANAQAVTVTSQGDSDSFPGDFTLDTDNDRVLLYSDGEIWWVVSNVIA